MYVQVRGEFLGSRPQLISEEVDAARTQRLVEHLDAHFVGGILRLILQKERQKYNLIDTDISIAGFTL